MTERPGNSALANLGLIARLSAAIRLADRVSLIMLLVANTLPILFALFLHWELGNVVLFYWMENIIIGVYAILRIGLAEGGLASGSFVPRQKLAPRLNALKFFLIPFFCMHYFGFCFAHGVFLMLFLVAPSFGSGSPGFEQTDIASHLSAVAGFFSLSTVIGLLVLVASHGVSFARNYLMRGEFHTANPGWEVFRPYARIVLLHVCILFGGFLAATMGSSLPMILLLMIGKTILDVIVHSVSHLRRRPTSRR